MSGCGLPRRIQELQLDPPRPAGVHLAPLHLSGFHGGKTIKKRFKTARFHSCPAPKVDVESSRCLEAIPRDLQRLAGVIQQQLEGGREDLSLPRLHRDKQPDFKALEPRKRHRSSVLDAETHENHRQPLKKIEQH